jgi:hypothetical protein
MKMFPSGARRSALAIRFHNSHNGGRDILSTRLFSFVGADVGGWRVTGMQTLVGPSLSPVSHLAVLEGATKAEPYGAWTLRGITSHERYVTRPEKEELVRNQPSLGRPFATLAALIPIQKSDAWWCLPQDERRKIFEEQSDHIRIGMMFLPAIARRLHHCRDLGPNEPFDFLTWFEYSVADAVAFDDLLSRLRKTVEWGYVTREIDIRLERV